MQKRTAFKLCLAGATAVALNAAPVAVFAKDEPLKVAFVYVSPANEEGWSSQHDIARKFVEEKFGDKIKVTWIENIPEMPTPSASSATSPSRATRSSSRRRSAT